MPPEDPDADVVVYSDYVCPFCHLGLQAFREAQEAAGVDPEVRWEPFDLRGVQRREDGTLDESVETGKDEAYFERARRNVQRLRERLGVDMVPLEEVEGVDSWNAMQAALSVRDEHPDAFEAFDEGLFRALWEEGRDIGDPDVLAEVADEVGLDGEAVAEAATDPDAGEELREALEASRSRGVRAVPTFLVGDRPIQGAAPPDQLRQVLEDL